MCVCPSLVLPLFFFHLSFSISASERSTWICVTSSPPSSSSSCLLVCMCFLPSAGLWLVCWWFMLQRVCGQQLQMTESQKNTEFRTFRQEKHQLLLYFFCGFQLVVGRKRSLCLGCRSVLILIIQRTNWSQNVVLLVCLKTFCALWFCFLSLLCCFFTFVLLFVVVSSSTVARLCVFIDWLYVGFHEQKI